MLRGLALVTVLACAALVAGCGSSKHVIHAAGGSTTSVATVKSTTRRAKPTAAPHSTTTHPAATTAPPANAAPAPPAVVPTSPAHKHNGGQKPPQGPRALPPSARGGAIVPNVVGETAGDASTTVARAGLKPEVVRAPAAAKRGRVFGENPPPGLHLQRGTTVQLIVSSGLPKPGQAPPEGTAPSFGGASQPPANTSPTPMTTVPGLRGLRLSAAVQRLVRAHLRVTVQYVRSPRRRGSVLSQQPAGGHKIAQANRVEVNVSASESARFRAVPDVLTATRVRAAKLVRNAGFVPLVVLVRSGDAQRGLVLDVQPAGASAAPAGAEIVLLVGAGARG